MKDLRTILEKTVLNSEGMNECDKKIFLLGEELGLLREIEVTNPDGTIEKSVEVNLEREDDSVFDVRTINGEEIKNRNELIDLFFKKRDEEITPFIPENAMLDSNSQRFTINRSGYGIVHAFSSANKTNRVGGLYYNEAFIYAGMEGSDTVLYLSNGGMKKGYTGQTITKLYYSDYPYGYASVNGVKRKKYKVVERAINIFDGSQSYKTYVDVGGYVFASFDTVSVGQTRKDWMRICGYGRNSVGVVSLGGDNYYADAGLLSYASKPSIGLNFSL